LAGKGGIESVGGGAGGSPIKSGLELGLHACRQLGLS
jgi:hypothetical protein